MIDRTAPRRRGVPLAILVAGLAVSGCAAVAPPIQMAQAGGAPSEVQSASATRRDSALPAEIQRRLAKPLTADDAVFIALVNNRGLRTTYLGVGILDEDLSRALGMIERGDGDIERRLVRATIGSLSRPMASEVERRKGDELKLQVAAEMLARAAETRKAHATALAAEQIARYTEQARTATEATLELTRRGANVGNWPKVNELREQIFHGEMTAQLARARQAAVSARERLTRLMGLWGQDVAYSLPDRLPDLPAEPIEDGDLEAAALKQRLDLQAAQIELIANARSMALDHYEGGALLTGRTQFTTLDEVDFFRDGTIRTNGTARVVRVPVFDRAQARLYPEMLAFTQALDRYAELGVTARSEVRDAYMAYRTAYDVAKHYQDEILPLRKQISDENVMRYNGMLIGVFDLLADAREQISTVIAAIEAQRDFWQAEADLRLAMTAGGASPGGGARTARAPSGGSAGH